MVYNFFKSFFTKANLNKPSVESVEEPVEVERTNPVGEVEFIEKWLSALESGEFKQTKSRLVSGNGQSFCCLGVACKLEGAVVARDVSEFNQKNLMILDGFTYDVYPSEDLLNKIGLTTLQKPGYLKATKYSGLNDDGYFDEEQNKWVKADFKYIAKELRKDYKEAGIL